MPPHGEGARAGPSDGDSPDWIDPGLLEDKDEDSICGVCFGVMVKPVSGCPEGHSFCRTCFTKALVERKHCPTCRAHVQDANKLVPNRLAENFIAKLRVRCEQADGEKGEAATGPSAAKRAKLAPAASMTVEALREELRQRGRETEGIKAALVARLEEDRMQGAGCKWKGCVGELAAHRGECEWVPVKCPNKGCTESPLRKDLAEHEASCEHRLACCRHCKKKPAYRLLAKHEASCPRAEIECEGCGVLYERGAMNIHRVGCDHEEVACACPGCDARLLRKGMGAHVEAVHQGSWVKLLQSAWRQNAALEERARILESEQRLASSSPTCWVSNWHADTWGGGRYQSEIHALGVGVTGECILKDSSNVAHSHLIGVGIKGRAKGKVHATFSILDKHDKTLRKVGELGTARAPEEFDFTVFPHRGCTFTPTAEDKAQSVRADGSIRLRAVVRLFLDDAA